MLAGVRDILAIYPNTAFGTYLLNIVQGRV
jgi:hypothetical protein